jgi:hypothetical protein
MNLRKKPENEADPHSFSEFPLEEENDAEKISHKRRVRKMIEDRLERKRLKDDLSDELDGDFDWDEFEER